MIVSIVYSNCTKTDNTFNCFSTTESIWFRITNATSAKSIITECDPIFYKKYANIKYMLFLFLSNREYKCKTGSIDTFKSLYKYIGISSPNSITMGMVISIESNQ